MQATTIYCLTTGFGENRRFNEFAVVVQKKLEDIGDGSAIVYTDFARHVGPIVCALHEEGTDAVGYYGAMSDKDKEESHSSWQNGRCKVMVATRAFGLGINKKNIRLVIRHGLPADLSSWVQEFGRAGRDGLPARACILYSDDDIQHLSYWLGNRDRQRESPVATAFSEALNFTYAHLARKCRHQVVLEGFGEQMIHLSDQCCDVCALTPVVPVDMSKELEILISAIDELGIKGEKKLAQFIRGSNVQWIKDLQNFDQKVSNAYGKSPSHLSMDWWRLFARQCSVAGYLYRKVDCGTFQGRQAGVFTYFKATSKGRDAIASNKEVMLPPLPMQQEDVALKHHSTLKYPNETVQKKKRVGRGSNPLSNIRELLSDKENWQDITSKEQYQFPGVSTEATLNKLLFCTDISKLPQYVATKPHFLWEDIQLSKGKLTSDRCVTIEINGSEESIFYRLAPCNGVKLCSGAGCDHVQSRNSKKNLCTNHPGSPTINTDNCPVIFVYMFPQNFVAPDNRR